MMTHHPSSPSLRRPPLPTPGAAPTLLSAMSGRQLARFVWGLVATGCFDDDLKLREAVARRIAEIAAASSSIVLSPRSAEVAEIAASTVSGAVGPPRSPRSGLMGVAVTAESSAATSAVDPTGGVTLRSSAADNNVPASTHSRFRHEAAETQDMVFLAWALCRLRNSPPLLGRQRFDGPQLRSLEQHQRSVAEAADRALAHVYAEVEAGGLGALHDRDVAALLFAFCGGGHPLSPWTMAGSGSAGSAAPAGDDRSNGSTGSAGSEDELGFGAGPRDRYGVWSSSIATSSPPLSLLVEAGERSQRWKSRSRDGGGGARPLGLDGAGSRAVAPAAREGASHDQAAGDEEKEEEEGATGEPAQAGVSDCMEWAAALLQR